MRRRAVISLIASCTLAACAHQTAAPVDSFRGMSWIEVAGDGPKLAFGVPESDVLVLMMTCAPRSGVVDLAFFGGPDARGQTLHLRSGPASARLAARATAPDAESPTNDVVVAAQAPAASPVLASFARTGELTVGVGAHPQVLPAAEPATARRFVEACRGQSR